jgi:hypothetical protein
MSSSMQASNPGIATEIQTTRPQERTQIEAQGLLGIKGSTGNDLSRRFGKSM